jgi:uncharacterized protein YcaQ
MTQAETQAEQRHPALDLTIEEARGVMLAAQGLLDPPPPAPDLAALRAMIERLGVVQVDTINVVRRSQYLVLWSRLGAYDDTLLDALLAPHRAIFEYWSHAASIVPMSDYPYYRADMLRAADGHLWEHLRHWKHANGDVLSRVLDAIHERGPLASADFERPADGRRASAWDWYGPKESRRALDVLWTTGELMIHSRRGGQKVYDLRERVLAEAFSGAALSDDDLPSPREQLRHFILRTARALGVLTPAWLWDYFRLHDVHDVRAHLPGLNGATAGKTPTGKLPTRRAAAVQALDALVREGRLLTARVAGLGEPAYLAVERVADLERLRGGETPERTTLLSPFDNLIWHRERTRALFGYEVCFEAYVVPEKRRYGYYCLAILHRGRLVGRLDPKMDRATRQLLVRAAYLEPGVAPDDALVEGLVVTLGELGRFLGATSIAVERSTPAELAPRLRERLSSTPIRQRRAKRAQSAAVQRITS